MEKEEATEKIFVEYEKLMKAKYHFRYEMKDMIESLMNDRKVSQIRFDNGGIRAKATVYDYPKCRAICDYVQVTGAKFGSDGFFRFDVRYGKDASECAEADPCGIEDEGMWQIAMAVAKWAWNIVPTHEKDSTIHICVA